ncbi:MAG: CIA30 family protein [Tunicatimonas sp.]|uniref:CIA30 family protein n=1 Tax=Tunicatimonas sp. TaxID=1940096 RepID=UPI003C761CCA
MSNPNKNIDSYSTDHENAKSDSSRVLYSFPEQGKGKWRVQDDVVMGGRSDSKLKVTAKNYAHFSGRVSLENNGGFCSIHQTVEEDPYVIAEKSVAFILLLKGDGKKYNFRVRTPNGRHSYGFTFPTKGNGEWETISIPFNTMEAKYHGESVEVPNYAGENIVEMQLLIGNNKEETFEILIKSIAAA